MLLEPRTPSQELVDLVGALRGTWYGRTAMCRCPAHSDTTPSLSLRQGDRGVVVTCFAGCEREDVLRALARVRPNQRFVPPPETRAPRPANVERLWRAAGPAGNGLSARYLARRNFPRVPVDLRFHPHCPHGPSPQTRFKPALLVGVREGAMLVALQRIFLDPETANYTEKVMLGRPGRGAWRSGSPGSTLAIAEGFETAEAFSLLRGVPCWASLGARRLDQIDIPASVTALLIAEDNDPEGRRASLRACEYHRRPGREVHHMPPPLPFKDWAEMLDHQAR